MVELTVAGARTGFAIGSAVIRLKPTSFRLLCCLAELEGQWVRAQLLKERVLATNFAPGASNLRWHVLQLRLALGSLSPFIHSDNRLGFMFAKAPCQRAHCAAEAELAALAEAQRRCGLAQWPPERAK